MIDNPRSADAILADQHECDRQDVAERLFRESEAMPMPRKTVTPGAAKRIEAIRAAMKAKRRRKRPA